VNVAGVVEPHRLESQGSRRHDEWENLVTARGAVRTHLVVERHDVLSVKGAE
jgi:hypothetical protein